MRGGFFFAPRPRSRGECSEALYEYRRGVHANECKLQTAPVYLALREDAAEFLFLGRLGGNRRIVQHLILRLPIGEQAILDDKLDDTLDLVYEGVWPPDSSETAPLVRLKSGEAAGYSTVNEFRQAIGGHTGAFGNAQDYLPTGRLLLDFLFDLEHSEVFGPHRQRFVAAFRSSPAMAALMDKLEYFWGLERAAGLTDTASSDPRIVELKHRKEAWLSRCLSSDARRILRSRWFLEDIEDEVRRVVFREGGRWQDALKINGNVGSPQAREADRREDERSRRIHQVATWFLRRYDLDAFLLVVLRDAQSSGTRVGRILAWLEASRLGWFVVGLLPIWAILFTAAIGVGAAQGSSHTALAFVGAAMGAPLVVTACWWLSRLAGTCGSAATQNLRTNPVRFVIALTTSSIGLVYALADLGAFECEAGALARRSLYSGLAIALPLGAVLYCGVLVLKRNLSGRLLGLLRLGLPRMFLAVTAAWILMMTTDEVVKANLLVGWSEIFPVFSAVALLAWLFAAVEVHTQIGSPRRALGRAAWLVAASFLISYFVGFAVTNFVTPRYLLQSGFVGGEEFEDRVEQLGDNIEGLRTRAVAQDHEAIVRRLEALQWGFGGAWLTRSEQAGIRVLYSADIYPLGRVYFFPGLHLYTALFAAFVGLFFTLVLNGNLLTDPLGDADETYDQGPRP